MPRPNAASRRLGSLPAKVALAVLLAIALRGLLVGGASVSFARDFFQQIVELTFPAQIERTAARVDAWLAAGHGHVKRLADDPRVLRESDAARRELEVQLADPRGAWDMQPDGTYVQRRTGTEGKARHSQRMLIDRAEKRLKEATRLRKRKPKGIARRAQS